MSCAEQQEEEREVLLSIYEGDGQFFDIAANQYQYKIGEDGANKSVMIEVKWGDGYPDELPEINLDLFYNKHLLASVKDAIKQTLLSEAENLIGSGSTYTLFEYAKENGEALLDSQPEVTTSQVEKADSASHDQSGETGGSQPSKQKKEQLTKNQKRRMYDKFGTQGMTDGKQRGWDWVDVVKHLHQTGAKGDGE